MITFAYDRQTGFLDSIDGVRPKSFVMPTAFSVSYADIIEDTLAWPDTQCVLATEDRDLLADCNTDDNLPARVDVQQTLYPELFAGTDLAIYSILN